MSRLNRREVLAGSVLALAASGRQAVAAPKDKLHLASNAYSWQVFYARDKRDFYKSLDEGLADLKKSDLDGLEPSFASVAEVERMFPLLGKHGLTARSVYVNSRLHDPRDQQKNIDQVLAIVDKTKVLGTRIIVTNPSPINWMSKEDKDDAQLRLQAEGLNKLGEALKSRGLTLAYHNHDPEMRQSAREFHHMMVGTNPKVVSLCLDAHWIFRGAGNSSVALFDIVKLYAARIVEVHLRQSNAGVWSETYGDGDIDYRALAQLLKQNKVKPHLVLEVAVEKGTPQTMTPVEAHLKSAAYAREVFSIL